MKDFLEDKNGELIILDGDLAISDSESQDIRKIIISNKGSYRFDNFIGFGLTGYINSKFRKSKFDRDLKEQLNYSNISKIVTDISFDNNNLNININK